MWNEDYRDMLCALNAEGVEYLSSAPTALAAHGFPVPHSTSISGCALDRQRHPHLCSTQRFGAPLTNLTASDFAARTWSSRLVCTPRVDLVTSVSGLTFERRAAMRCAGSARFDRPILSLPDLIHNKLAAGRPKDLTDADLLQKHLSSNPAFPRSPWERLCAKLRFLPHRRISHPVWSAIPHFYLHTGGALAY